MRDQQSQKWKTVPLGELCHFQGGTQPPKSKFVDSPREGYVRLLQIRDFKSDDKAVYVPDDGKLKKCVQSDIMIGRYGASVGQIHKGKAGAYNVALIRTSPDLDRLDHNFFYYYLTSELFQKPLLARSARGAQNGFNRADIAPFPVPLPPLEEQRRIVAMLDEAFEGLDRARENAEVNLQNARELIAESLRLSFGQELSSESENSFDDITADTLIGLVRSKKEQGPDKAFDYVKMNNIGNDDRYLGGVVDRVDCNSEEATRFLLQPGDFLFNTRNSRELVGKSCVIAGEPEKPTVFNNNIMRVRFKPDVLPEYVALVFRSPAVKAQLENMKSGTTSVVAIYHKSLKKLRLPVPSVERQRHLIARFQSLSAAQLAVSENYARQLVGLDELHQSLLQKAFAGELT